MAFNGKRGKHVGGNGGRGGASGRGGSHGWEAPQDYHVGEGSDPGNDTGLTLLHQEFTTSAGGIEVMRATTQDHRRWEQPYSFRTFLTAAATLFKRDMFSLSGIVAYRINEETPIPPVLITLGRSLDFEPNFQQHRALADLVTTCDEGDIIYVNSDCTWNQNACAVPDCPVNLTGWSVEQRLAHTDTHSNDTTAIEGASAGHKLQAYEKRVQGLREEVALLRQQNERLRREKDDAVAKHVTSEARLQGEKLTVQQPTKSDGTRTKQLSNQLANELQRIAIFEQREIKLKDENDALKEAVAKNDLQPLQDQLSAEQEKNADLQKEIDNLLEQIQDAQPPPVDESVLQSLRDQSSTAQNDNDGLRKEIESLRQQINDVQSTPVDEAGLQAQLIETQNQLKDSEGTLRTIINRLGAAEIDLDKTRSKLLSAGTNVDDMANDINELQSSNQTLQTALEDCRAIHEDLKAQLTAKPAKGVIPKLRKEIALLQKDLDNCRASHKELEASNQKLEASNIKLIKKTPQKPGNGSPAGSQKEVADLRNTIKDLHKELALCIARHDTMKDTNTELMKQIAAKPATGSPTKLQKELAALRIKHESLQEEMTNAMDRNETLEKQLAAQSGDGQGQTAHPIHPDDPNRRQPLRPAEAKAYSNRYCNWCGERVDRLGNTIPDHLARCGTTLDQLHTAAENKQWQAPPVPAGGFSTGPGDGEADQPEEPEEQEEPPKKGKGKKAKPAKKPAKKPTKKPGKKAAKKGKVKGKPKVRFEDEVVVEEEDEDGVGEVIEVKSNTKASTSPGSATKKRKKSADGKYVDAGAEDEEEQEEEGEVEVKVETKKKRKRGGK